MQAPPGKRAERLTAPLTALAAASCRRPWLVLAVVLALAGASLVLAATRLGIDTSTEDMLSPELPFRQSAQELTRLFPLLDQTLIVVVEGADSDRRDAAALALAEAMAAKPTVFAEVFYPEAEPFFREHGLLYLSPEELAATVDRLAAAQPLLTTLDRDPSLKGLDEVLTLAFGAAADPALLEELGPALDAMADAAESAGSDDPRPLFWQALMGLDSANEEQRARVILAQPALDYRSLNPARQAMEQVRALAEELELAKAGVSIGLTGKPALKADELQSVRGNIAGIGLLSFALVALILWRGLASGRAALALAALLLLGLALTAGFATLAVGRLNLLSVAFAVLFIGLSVDYAIHSLMRIDEARLPERSLAEAVVQAYRANIPALSLCALSTAIAFLAFLPTAYDGLAELGLISAGGIAIALLLCLTLLPALIRLFRVRPSSIRPGRLAARLERGIAARRWPVLAALSLLAAASLAAMPQLRFDNDPLALRDPDSPSVVSLESILSDPRAAPFRADILEPDLDAADALAAKLLALPEVDRVVTARRLVPKEQEEKLIQLEEAGFLLTPLLFPEPPAPPLTDGERATAAAQLIATLDRAPESLSAPAQRLAAVLAAERQSAERLAAVERLIVGDLPQRLDDLTASLTAGEVRYADLPESLLRRYVAPGGQARVEVLPTEDLRDPDKRQEFVAAVTAVAPAAAGDAVTVVLAGETVLAAFQTASLITLVAVTLLIWLVLRRIADVALALAPLLLAAILTGGVAVLFGIDLNFANVVVVPLLFGIGIDSGLHLVVRHREAPGAPLMENTTPRAVFVSAVTTLASFGALALSDHPGTASMGLLLLIALLCVLLSVFALLPALIGRRA